MRYPVLLCGNVYSGIESIVLSQRVSVFIKCLNLNAYLHQESSKPICTKELEAEEKAEKRKKSKGGGRGESKKKKGKKKKKR